MTTSFGTCKLELVADLYILANSKKYQIQNASLRKTFSVFNRAYKNVDTQNIFLWAKQHYICFYLRVDIVSNNEQLSDRLEAWHLWACLTCVRWLFLRKCRCQPCPNLFILNFIKVKILITTKLCACMHVSNWIQYIIHLQKLNNIKSKNKMGYWPF